MAMASTSESTTAEHAPPRSLFDLSRLKDALKKYGRTGVVVYLLISFAVTAGWYLAIERHVDVRQLLGMKDDPTKEPSWLQSVLIGKGSNLALAFLCGKAYIPIKIPLAVAITPYIQRWREQLGKAWTVAKPID